MRLFAVLVLVTMIFASCITPRGMTSSTTPIQGRKYTVLGKSEGSAGSWSVLALWSIGRPDIDQAILEAVKSKNGDALINVRWYEKTYYLILVSYTSIIVTGDVIKFQE